MRRSITIGLLVWGCASAALSQETVRELSWTELKKSGQRAGGEIQPGGPSGPQQQLRIDNPSGDSKSVTLLEIENPGITTLHYGVEGAVRYENVQGESYLEMWSHFSDGGPYFTRTLGESGPMGHLQGSSGWRPFELPFFSDTKTGMPNTTSAEAHYRGSLPICVRRASVGPPSYCAALRQRYVPAWPPKLSTFRNAMW